MSEYCSLLGLVLIQLWHHLALQSHWLRRFIWSKVKKWHFWATFKALNDWNKMSDYFSLLSLCLIQLMTSFCLEKALTESIYIVKSKKKFIFEPLSATFVALNEWNKISDYYFLLILGLIQLMASFSFKKSLTEVICMVKSKKNYIFESLSAILRHLISGTKWVTVVPFLV